MKYENLSEVIDICKKIADHKDLLEKLRDSPTMFLIPYGYFDQDRAILKINPGTERGHELWVKEFIDKVIADYEERIETLTHVLNSL